jgi:hypothetical protein
MTLNVDFGFNMSMMSTLEVDTFLFANIINKLT